MKLVGVVILSVAFLLSSCEKYKLNQPAYLSFQWDFFNNSSSNEKATISSGSFYIDEFEVSGKRVKGSEIDIEQKFPVQNTSFTSKGSLGLSMDIPVGDYTEFSVELNVKDAGIPCMRLVGAYNDGSMVTPVLIEWNVPKSLIFKPANGFTLKKKEDYKITLGIDVNRLFSNVSTSQWEQASVTPEGGIPTIVVRDNYNISIFNDIENQLNSALILTVN